jgi:hypothetical protein
MQSDGWTGVAKVMGLFLRVFDVERAKMLPVNFSLSNGTEESINMRRMLQALIVGFSCRKNYSCLVTKGQDVLGREIKT